MLKLLSWILLDIKYTFVLDRKYNFWRLRFKWSKINTFKFYFSVTKYFKKCVGKSAQFLKFIFIYKILLKKRKERKPMKWVLTRMVKWNWLFSLNITLHFVLYHWLTYIDRVRVCNINGKQKEYKETGAQQTKKILLMMKCERRKKFIAWWHHFCCNFTCIQFIYVFFCCCRWIFFFFIFCNCLKFDSRKHTHTILVVIYAENKNKEKEKNCNAF